MVGKTLVGSRVGGVVVLVGVVVAMEVMAVVVVVVVVIVVAIPDSPPLPPTTMATTTTPTYTTTPTTTHKGLSDHCLSLSGWAMTIVALGLTILGPFWSKFVFFITRGVMKVCGSLFLNPF